MINLLKNKTELATVIVSLFEREHDAPPIPLVLSTFPMQISSTFDLSCHGLVWVAKLVVLIAVAIAPWLLTAGTLSIPVWFIRHLLVHR